LLEAASRLVPQDELKPLKKKMGEALVWQLSTEELNSGIFVIANLYNDGSPSSTPEERLKVAKINLKAAIHSAQRSAIEAASKYAATGIDLLPDDKWESHSDISRHLYTIACRVEGCLGNHSRLEELSNEILDRKEIPLMERLPVSYSVLEMFESQDGRFPEAIDLCLDILRQLGCKFPTSQFGQLTGTIASLVKIKSTTKKLTLKVISEIKFMTDEKLIMTMKLLDKLGALCFISASPLFPMVVCRSLNLTLRHGLCESSPAAFALVGVLLVAAFADFQGGSVYASQAMGLMKKLPNGEAVESRVTFLSHFFVLPWTRPTTSMVKPMFRAYEIGLRTGDTDSAVYAIGTYVVLAIISGRPLQGLADDCRVYFGQMRELGR
jgi:predicted ATPase